jgi:hypothetical protein
VGASQRFVGTKMPRRKRRVALSSCTPGARRFAACTPNRGKRLVSVGTTTTVGRRTARHKGQGGRQLRWAGLGNGTAALSAAVQLGAESGTSQPVREGGSRPDWTAWIRS